MSASEDRSALLGDELDDLYSYDVNTDDAFKDFNETMDVPAIKGVAENTILQKRSVDLGIEEAIQVTKKRRPIAKLDETRLLSQAGIPKLRRIAKERLKFKGKGHEYSDVARLLNFYQLWLDDLYPRAKFADGLAIIEKLGHTKPIQIMRREWINEGKPKERLEEPVENGMHGSDTQQKKSSQAASTFPATLDRARTPLPSGHSDEPGTPTSRLRTEKDKENRGDIMANESLFLSEDEDHDQPPEDDLDALLAEDAQKERAQVVSRAAHDDGNVRGKAESQNKQDGFEDEMEAMAGMEGIW